MRGKQMEHKTQVTQKTQEKNRDLTVGAPGAVLWRFCLPLFGSVVFQQLYNVADSLVAGKYIGEAALAAVGNSYEITLIFLAFAMGCNIGCSVLISQLYGARKIGEMRTAVHTSFWVSGVVCAVMMILGLTLSRLLLALIDTPMRLMADSVLYLDIYVMGLPFVFFYNIANGIFSALGDSRTPFLFLAASSLSNIGMDILFVKVFGMKVDGVAWATFLCQGVSCVLAIIFVFHRLHSIKSEEKSRLFSFHLFRQFCRIAIPSTLQQSFISVGNIIIQGVINGFGTEVIAGYSAAIKMNNLVITSFNTVSNGISNYTGQNLGAGMVQRVRSGFAAGLKMMGGIGVAFSLIYWFAADWLVRLFMEDPSAGALQSGVSFLHIVAPFYVIVAAKLVADGVLRGASCMGPFMVSTFTDLLLRVALAILLSAPLGSNGIWSAWPVGWTIAAVMALTFYFRGKWQTSMSMNA